ncbi:MAG: integrase family protein [Candidatus Angelobacter sp.]|nr:integrase family protein [Candidatus Angelobacter sp.]
MEKHAGVFLKFRKGKYILRIMRTDPACGKKVETTRRLGVFENAEAAWKEVERRGFLVLTKRAPLIKDLASAYTRNYGCTLSLSSQQLLAYNLQHILRRWGNYEITQIKKTDLLAWVQYLRQIFATSTTDKIRGTMAAIFHWAQDFDLVPSDFHDPFLIFRKGKRQPGFRRSRLRKLTITPKQAFAIAEGLNGMERCMVWLCVATGMRQSELLGLRWNEVDFQNECVYIVGSWCRGEYKMTKTEASEAVLPLKGKVLDVMKEWHRQTPYSSAMDWCFPSLKLRGKKPRNGQMIVADYLRPAAIRAGVALATGQKFGWHTFRRSLATYLTRLGCDIKSVQGMMRHSRIATTMEEYAQHLPSGLVEAQNRFLAEVTTGHLRVTPVEVIVSDRSQVPPQQ